MGAAVRFTLLQLDISLHRERSVVVIPCFCIQKGSAAGAALPLTLLFVLCQVITQSRSKLRYTVSTSG